MLKIEAQRDLKIRGGFSLLEVLVALIVTSLFLSLLLPIAQSSMKRISLSSEKNRALILAKTKLEEFCAMPHAVLGEQNGTEEDFSWTVVTTNVSAADGSASGVVLRQLRVQVRLANEKESMAELVAQKIFAVQ